MYKFNLHKDSFVKSHLYMVSKSKKISIALSTNLFNVLVLLNLMGIISIQLTQKTKSLWHSIIFIFSYIFLFFLYDISQKFWYKLFYREIINEKFGKEEFIEIAIDFDDFYFYWIDKSGERKILYNAIDKFVKTKKYIFLILKNKDILPIPQNFKGFEDFISKIKVVLKTKGIDFMEDLKSKI